MAPVSFPALRGTNEGYRKSTAARVVAFCRLFLRLRSFFPEFFVQRSTTLRPSVFPKPTAAFFDILLKREASAELALLARLIALFPFQKLETSTFWEYRDSSRRMLVFQKLAESYGSRRIFSKQGPRLSGSSLNFIALPL